MNNPLSRPTARLELDLDRSGKNFGHIAVAQSTNISAWGELNVPVVCINNGPGPTVLLLGGTHGDEYEGQLVLLRLAEELTADEVTGRIILIPRLSGEASQAGRRLWEDGSNFNRVFPGDPAGTISERLADFLTQALFPLSDVVTDIHSGGRSMVFAPMATIQVPEESGQRRRMLDAAEAWLTPFCYAAVFAADGAGLLNDEAATQGKTVATAELGGAGMTSPTNLAIAYDGVVNLLRHSGVLRGAPSTRVSRGLDPTQYVEIAGPGNFLRAHEQCLFEPSVEPGDLVSEGEPLGRMRFPDRPDRPSEPVNSPMDGVVCVLRSMPNSDSGDCLAVVGRVVDVAHFA